MKVRKMKEPGSYAEAVAVKQDGWAAEDSDEEGSSISTEFHYIFMRLSITIISLAPLTKLKKLFLRVIY